MLLFLALAGGAAAAAVVNTGVVSWAWGAASVACAGVLVVVLVGVYWPRTTRLPAAGPDGAVLVRAPVVLVGAVLGAWFAILASAGAWGYLALTDRSAIESGRLAGSFILFAIVSLPELARLLTGRLHRWTLVLDHQGLSYQGYRSLVDEPWSSVRDSQVSWERRREGVLVDLLATRPDLLVPWTAFLVHPQVLADAISERARARG